MSKLLKNDLVRTFVELEGNPKWSLITEPLWYIPFSLFSPFASLYMYQIGLTSQQIGLLITIGFVLQMFCAFIGGVIADKMGRRLSTLIFDFIAWSIPCLIWAFAQNFWWFLAATIFNATFQITNTTWNCLFIEDCPAKHLTNAFTLTQVTGLLSVFFAPLAVMLVNKYSVVDVVSVIYFISAISMGAKFILLYIFGSETQIGKVRMEETKNTSYIKMFAGYKDVFKKIFTSNRMMFVLAFMAIANIFSIAISNFFSLYVTQKLLISDEYIAIFPVVRTVIMLLFIVILQNLMNKLHMRKSLLVGLSFYIISHLILIITPAYNIFLVILYTLFEAIAFAIVMPRKDALMAFYVDVNDRSRIYAVFNAGTIAVSAPFGIIIGALFDYNPVFPFILNILLFVIMGILVITLKAIRSYDEETENHISS